MTKKSVQPENPKEFLTWLLAGIIYGSWFSLTLYFHSLPTWLAFLLASFITAWHSSLQHETIHGHPTKKQRVNDVLGYPPLGLVYPYPLYKHSHLDHHATDHLTHPIEDPESYYVTPEEWERISPCSRFILNIHNTVFGRLLFGPAIAIFRLLRMEFIAISRGDCKNISAWVLHVFLSSLLMCWVTLICEISLPTYLLFFVYPGLSLILLRSFAEHRADEINNDRRSAIVESELPFRILYLGNNYHHLHHKAPGIPWYDLHACYQNEKDTILAENGSYQFKGYFDIFRRYAFWIKEAPLHPVYTEHIRSN